MKINPKDWKHVPQEALNRYRDEFFSEYFNNVFTKEYLPYFGSDDFLTVQDIYMTYPLKLQAEGNNSYSFKVDFDPSWTRKYYAFVFEHEVPFTPLESSMMKPLPNDIAEVLRVTSEY